MSITEMPQRVVVRSGAYLASGIHVVGDFTAEIASGLGVVIQSGIGVVGDFTAEVSVSGQPVTISGQHVYVESGTHVVGDFPTVESGLGVVVQSGLGVIGDFTTTVESGLHVIVESGIGVVGDFSTEVSVSGQPVTISGQTVVIASGVFVLQSKEVQLQNYFVSDIDESNEGIKFYGYKYTEGNWYIMRGTSGTTYRYASSGVYASNWIDRSGLIYQDFEDEFP